MDDLIAQRNATLRRVRHELRRLIREAGVSRRELEARNGFTDGRLDAVLDGDSTLTVQHLYAVLLTLEIAPADFFAELTERYDLGPVGVGEVRGPADFLAELDLIDRLRSGV